MQQTLLGFDDVRGSWHKDDILVTVKAYPNPSRKYRETSCVAGIRLRDNSWVRIHPVPFRDLPKDQRFKKYAVIRAWLARSTDPRSESHRYNLDSDIEHIGTIDTDKGTWRRRNEILFPLRSPDVEYLRNLPRYLKSLALVQVRQITRLEIREQEPQWSKIQLDKLSGRSIFTKAIKDLKQPEYAFYYHWLCQNPECRGHRMQIIDWEVIESYRSWSVRYGTEWETKFRLKYVQWMQDRNLHFYLGTLQKRPNNWTIIGIYYPPVL